MDAGKSRLDVGRSYLCVWQRDGSTPLASAIKNGHIDVVRMLLTSGATVDRTLSVSRA